GGTTAPSYGKRIRSPSAAPPAWSACTSAGDSCAGLGSPQSSIVIGSCAEACAMAPVLAALAAAGVVVTMLTGTMNELLAAPLALAEVAWPLLVDAGA